MTREEAIDYNKNLRMYMKLSDKNQPCKFLEENYIALDMAIKSLKQEPKTGHWIDDEFGIKCSYCGIHTHLDKFDRPMKFKYCSMCGAKMEGAQEGNKVDISELENPFNDSRFGG